ncbi:MAG: protein kinase [Planctomycetes bacterium]|nr:protein kinase [Planctomycetota bacterium]
MGSIVCVDSKPGSAHALARRGHAVTRIEDATQASAFFERPADLWLIQEGAGATRALRIVSRLRTQSGADFPILYVTAHDDERAVLRAYEAGASTVLTPPLSPAQLVVRTGRLLGKDAPAGPVRGEAHVAPGTLWHERYVLEELLGRGGCATVHRALDRKSGQAVAIKIAHRATWDSAIRERVAREAKSLSAVTCPQAPRLLRFARWQGHDYMVLELIRGSTVSDHVRQHGPLSADEGVDLLLGLSLALFSLTHHGLVHRDLKPANVVLRGGDPADPVLVDFGLARAPDRDLLTDPDVLVGTIGYMAPEYVLGEPLGPQADLFSLGHLVRFALTGKEPFPGLYGYDLLQRMAQETVPIPNAIPDPLRSLLQRMVEVDPERRPAGPGELLETLARSVAQDRKWRLEA